MAVGKLTVKPPPSHTPKSITGSRLIPVTMKSLCIAIATVFRVNGQLDLLAPKTNRGSNRNKEAIPIYEKKKFIIIFLATLCKQCFTCLTN